jgi:hypothetical protein
VASTVVTLGAFTFEASSLVIRAMPRTVGVSANALAPYPMQTVDFISGYRPITISGFLRGLDTMGETAAEHLVRLKSNLRIEVAKDANILTVTWAGVATPDAWAVYKNDDVEFVHEAHIDKTHMVEFSVTLNCLP